MHGWLPAGGECSADLPQMTDIERHLALAVGMRPHDAV
jgi:hypothetical protein